MDKRNIIIDVIVAAAGLMMIAAPEKCVQIIVILLGCGAIINGIIYLTASMDIVESSTIRTGITISAWISIIVGILAIMLPLVFASIVWTAMVYMLAIYLSFMAVMRIIAFPSFNKAGQKHQKYIVEIVLEILVAIILFFIPASLGKFLIRFVGIILLAGAVFFFIYQWRNKAIIEDADSVTDDE